MPQNPESPPRAWGRDALNQVPRRWEHIGNIVRPRQALDSLNRN